MLAIDNRAARYTWSAVLVLLLLYLVYLLRHTLFVFVIALLLAYLLHPLVSFLDRILPSNRTRTLALALAYVIFVGILILIGSQIGARVVDQANTFIKEFPALLSKWQNPSPAVPESVNSFKAQLIQKIEEMVRSATTELLATLPSAGAKFLELAGELVYVVVIPILAFFFLKDAGTLRQDVLATVTDSGRRELLEDLMADVHLLLAHYMRALVILSAATFVSYGTCFLILKVPYTLMLAFLAALLEFLPMIGPLTAAVLITLVTALAPVPPGEGHPVLPVLIFIACYRIFQDYVLSPSIMGKGIEMHPLAVLFGVFAGAELAGVAGAFLSVPVLALLRIVYRRVRKARVVAEMSPVSGP